MKVFLTILAISISLASFGQKIQESDFNFEANLPDKMNSFYYKDLIWKNYTIRKDLNPFYLRGDFDGDKKMDYAVGIVEKKNRKKGILIYHMGTKKYFIVGAGKTIGNGGDNYNWIDAWEIYDEKTVEAGTFDTGSKQIAIKGEAIRVEKLESARCCYLLERKRISLATTGRLTKAQKNQKP